MPPELLNAPLWSIALAVLGASAIVSLALAVVLRLAAESVFKHPVRYFDSVKAMFVQTLILNAIIFTLTVSDVVALEKSGGIALQIIGLAVGLVILAFTISAFIRSPDGRRPDFAQSSVVAAIMQVVSLLIALAITTLDLPMKGL